MLGEEKLKQALVSVSEDIAECGGSKSIDVNLKGDGEYRSGTYSISFKGDCSLKEEEVKLVKEEGKWKLAANK